MEWFKKGGDSIDDVDIVLDNIVEGVGTNNQVAPPHGVPIGSYIFLVGGGWIL